MNTATSQQIENMVREIGFLPRWVVEEYRNPYNKDCVVIPITYPDEMFEGFNGKTKIVTIEVTKNDVITSPNLKELISKKMDELKKRSNVFDPDVEILTAPEVNDSVDAAP